MKRAALFPLVLAALLVACSAPDQTGGPPDAVSDPGPAASDVADAESGTASDSGGDPGTGPDLVVADLGPDPSDPGTTIDSQAADLPDTGDPGSTPDVATDPGTDVVVAPVPTIAWFDEILAAADASGLDAFLAVYDMPVCEAGICLFVTVQPDADEVVVLGEFNGWTGGLPATPVPFAPDVHHARTAISFDAWTEYKLTVDGVWTIDRSDRYIRFGGYGPNSAIYAPGQGRLALVEDVHSPELGNDRDLFVYLPAAYFADATARLPVLYLQDGFNVFQNPLAPFGTWDVEVTSEAMIAKGLAAPVVLVGIDTSDRLNEYLHTAIDLGDGTVVTPKLAEYATFLVDTVKPRIDALFRTRPDRASTGIAGSSLGGISALWIAWNHPDVFSRVGSFSGSYWVGEDGPVRADQSMRDVIEASGTSVEPGSLRIYMDAGDSDDSGASYAADAWGEGDWTRNCLIAHGWDNRPEWDTDSDLATPPADLPLSTSVLDVPALDWAEAPPAGYAGWADWLGLDRNLLSLVGRGHAHNEAAWRKRFGAALVYLFPGGVFAD